LRSKKIYNGILAKNILKYKYFLNKIIFTLIEYTCKIKNVSFILE